MFFNGGQREYFYVCYILVRFYLKIMCILFSKKISENLFACIFLLNDITYIFIFLTNLYNKITHLSLDSKATTSSARLHQLSTGRA